MRQGFKGLFESVLPKSPQVTDQTNRKLKDYYYCGDERTEPISRDLYIEFSQARREQAVDRMNEFDKFETNIRMLQMKINTTSPEKPEKLTKTNPVDLTSRFWSHIPHQTKISTPLKTSQTKNTPQTCEYCE